jgi:tRNA-dihydrouridine synthase
MKPIYFSPLQGYTEDAYRRIHAELAGGVDVYYTPFVRVEHGKLRSKDVRDVRPDFNAGVNVVPQIIANGASEVDLLFDHFEQLGCYREIDLNMGCPFPLQVRHGRGAGLLTDKDKVREVLAQLRTRCDRASESGKGAINFTVKMRLGIDDASEWKELLPIIEEYKPAHITLHPRVAKQQYGGELHMEEFARFYESSSLPIVYNGDVCSLEDLSRMESEFPRLKAVMIGRGLLARPSLAREYSEGKEWDDARRMSLVMDMHRRLLAHFEGVIPGEEQLLSKVRTFWDFMEEELGRKAFKKIKKAGNLKNYLKAVSELG